MNVVLICVYTNNVFSFHWDCRECYYDELDQEFIGCDTESVSVWKLPLLHFLSLPVHVVRFSVLLLDMQRSGYGRFSTSRHASGTHAIHGKH